MKYMLSFFVERKLYFFLSISIWFTNTVYSAVMSYLSDIVRLSDFIESPLVVFFFFVIIILINGCIQAIFIILACGILFRKRPIEYRWICTISLPLMYLLFALFHIPYYYMFILTDSWGMFFNVSPAMPSYIAAFWILGQYSIVLFTTVFCHNKKQKS